MPLEERIDLFVRLGEYMLSENADWIEAQQRAVLANAWFTEESISLSIKNIVSGFLQKEKLQAWTGSYKLPATPRKTGIIMAGNLPLVGFHDFLCGFICGHELFLKLSSKDSILLKTLIGKLAEWQPEVASLIHIQDMLKGCDAYIATGSNNSARYFEQYFSKYPHVIRRNRTSVAVLTGNETREDLTELAKDVFTYFGLGCRNVTQVHVPESYDFSELLEVFSLHKDIMHHHKYKNNFDYHLAVYLLNKVPCLTNDSILLVENPLPFSAVSVLYYQHYQQKDALMARLKTDTDIQCIVGKDPGLIPFGKSQEPGLYDYADGVDIMAFLSGL